MYSRRFFFRMLGLPFAAAAFFGLSGLTRNGTAFAATDAVRQGGSLKLSEPRLDSGLTLMQALARRKSTRSFSSEPLPDQILSELLWAAWGVNRPNGHRTAPTALNEQRVELFAAMESGVWRYDGKKHSLELALERDMRRAFGGAPLTLLFAADEGPFGSMHLGALYQNVGLYCASAGLANVVKASGVNLAQEALSLPEGYSVRIVQSVGLPV